MRQEMLEIFPFLPDARGTVLICPGGAYSHLSDRESGPVARMFLAAGWNAAVLHYSVGERSGLGWKPLSELSEAVDVLRGMTDGPVGVCGFSAGGHLAASLGVYWKEKGLARPDFLILSYPVITAGPYANEESVLNLLADGLGREEFSLEKHVTGDVPPVFLWATAADADVPVQNTLLFADALSGAKVPFEMHVYPFGVHGLSLATEEVAQPEKARLADPHVAQWAESCARWLEYMDLRRAW